MNREKEMRSNRQVKSASAIKHSNLTTSVGAVSIFLLMWALGTYGLGHVFGVI